MAQVLKSFTASALVAASLLPAQAQVVMAGSYQNFDVLNNTGAPTYGFEMEVWGISKSHLTRIFPSNFYPDVIRYGFGSATDFPGGVNVRWAARYDPATGRWSTATPVPPSLTSVPGESCWTLGMPATYASAGCEHFGISSTLNPSRIVYYWLVPDPAVPGNLMRTSQSVSIPAPTWSVVQPANPALPPVVAAEVPAPPPRVVAQFGDAQWVRVYKTENAAKVELEQLVGDNRAVVPEQAAQLEVSWSLLQADPPDGGRKRQRGKLANQGNVGAGNRAVVRRYEYYKYAGAYDPVTHEALCADLTCTAPSPGELGDAVGAQNAAANLDVNALTVSVLGSGSVSSSDKVIACPNKCQGVYTPGSTVTLTVKPASGNTFSGWSGACTGVATNCTVTLNAEKAVTATFAAQAGGGGGGGGGAGGGSPSVKLVLATSGSGTVVSTPAGIDCGKTCSAAYTLGTTVALRAVPAAGKAFTGWTGACSGLDPNACVVTLNADTKVQAGFSK
ncbi:InlB B-repeat-containing protein [Roseateles sp. BYS87W]|uniref:Bacterial repeat domain-containing protein n=1 Tax=Pelomonas baiyunensis TaxID=3299026 RepID=A0ABW7GVY5_9BURK